MQARQGAAIKKDVREVVRSGFPRDGYISHTDMNKHFRRSDVDNSKIRVLIRQTNNDRINVTSIESVASSCS